MFVEATLERWPGSHQLKPEFTTGITDVAQAWDEGKIAGQYAEWIRNFDPIRRYGQHIARRRASRRRDDLVAIDKSRRRSRCRRRAIIAEASPFPKPESAVTGAFA